MTASIAPFRLPRAQDLGDILDPQFHQMHRKTSAELLFGVQQSFMYSVQVLTLQTERGRNSPTNFRMMPSKSMQNFMIVTPTKMAQQEIVELIAYITNLRLTDSWKGTTQQFLTHFKEKLCLLDSLVEESDKIPKTTHIVVFEQAVESIPDLCYGHCLASKDWFFWLLMTKEERRNRSKLIYVR